MGEYKKGNFVQTNGLLCTIAAIKDGFAVLGNGQEVEMQDINPVLIGSSLDNRITLVCNILRHPHILGEIPLDTFRYYQDCYISKDKTIRDVLKENPQIKFLHQLQEWLSSNEEDFHLQSWIGCV